jgi:NitT/TauT family transport system substrate-binding protein
MTAFLSPFGAGHCRGFEMSVFSDFSRGARAGLFALTFAGSGFAFAGTALAADDVSVRLNWFAGGYSSPFYLGVEKGFYRDANINLTVQEGQGSGATVQQVAAGRTDFGFVSADAAVRAVAQGAPIKMVANIANDAGYCTLVKAESGINSFKDMAGKKYGATAYSSVAKLLPAALKNAGVPDEKVQRVSMDAANLYAAFLGNQFDGMEALTFDEPPHFDAEGHKVKCLDYTEVGIKVLGLGIVASQSEINNKPDLVKRFVAASLRSFAYSFEHPDEAAAAGKKMVGDSIKDVNVAAAQLKLFEKLQPKPLGSMQDADWKQSIEYLAKYLNIENAPPDTSKYYTGAFLPKP